MTITVSGLGSGLDYNSWITQLVALKQTDIDKVSSQVSTITSQENALNSVKSDYSNLLTSIQTFTDILSSKNIFNQKSASSSASSITAKVDSTADIQNLSITVDKLATATVAKSASVAGAYVGNSSKMSDISEGAFKAGNFSVYVGGAKSTIDIAANETLGDVVTALNQIGGVSASISNDGKLTIAAATTDSQGDPINNPPTVTIGSSSDTSNFKNVMALSGSNSSYTSTKSLFSTNTANPLIGGSFAGSTAITAGNFTIGNAVFTIDNTTTMDGLISQINNNTDAGVTAAWDSTAGKLVLTSTDQGAVNINVQAGDADGATADSNFTDVMGLTSGGNLAANSQTLGTDASLTINGNTITSTSNTVTSDISGIKGLTLTLTDKTTSTATVSVSADTAKISSAITTFVNAFNSAISDTASATSAGTITKSGGTTTTSGKGLLYGETSLSSFGNKIRTLATSSVTGSDVYKTLAAIGITTGAVGASVTDNTNKLSVDTTKLTAALKDNPDEVMKLLVGDKTAGTTGVLSNMQDKLTTALDSTKGYFASRKGSYEKQATRLNTQITTMNTNLTTYQKQLQTKFSAMDTLISKLKNSASVFDSYFNSKSSSS